MLIIVNSGNPTTHFGPSLLLESVTISQLKKLGEKLFLRFTQAKQNTILLSPKDENSSLVGNIIYPEIRGTISYQPTENLIDWIHSQKNPVLIILTNEAANKMARSFWVETSFYDDLDVPYFGPNEAIVIDPPHVTTIRASY